MLQCNFFNPLGVVGKNAKAKTTTNRARYTFATAVMIFEIEPSNLTHS
jgi:hypothetical protein